jgi:branched-chain amino acid transport system permease protein
MIDIDFLVIAATFVGFFVILGAGLNLQWGMAGLANFGPVGFFAVGAYVTGLAMTPPPEDGGVQIDTFLFTLGLPWPVAALLAASATAAVALVVGYALLRTDIEPIFMAVITLAFAEILFLLLITQDWLANGFNGIRGIDRPLDNLVTYEHYDRLFLVFVAVVAVTAVAFVRLVQASPYGRVLKGIREDAEAIESLGHDIRWFRLSAFVLGCMIISLAGALWAPYATVVEPSAFGTEQTFLIWSVLIIGGAGNALGPVVGAALLIGLVQQGTRFLPAGSALADFMPSVRGMLIGLLFILFVRFRPEGIAAEQPRRVHPPEDA